MRDLDRIRTTIALTSALVCCGSLAASATSVSASSTIYVQEQSNWCWAAASKTLIHHYAGGSPAQCTVVKWGKASSSCPNSAGSFGLDVSRALTGGGLSNIGSLVSYSIGYAQIKAEVTANRHTLVRWDWGDGTGHMIVLVGYDDSVGQQVKYINPLESSYQWNDLSWLKSGGGHTWSDTRYLIYG